MSRAVALTPTKSTPDADKKAAKIAAQDEVLLREIDDAVRQDDYAQFAKRFGVPILTVIVLGLAAFGGFLFWQNQQEAAMQADSEKLVAALDQLQAGNLQTADETATALAESSEGGAGIAARLLRAGIAVQEGREADAVEIYSALAASEDTPVALRDLATIREVALTFDDRDPDEVVARLKPLAVPGNAWFGSAGELVAMAYLEKGDEAQAGALLSEIAKSEDVPETMRVRSRQLAGLLGVDAIEDVEKLMEEQGLAPSSGVALGGPGN